MGSVIFARPRWEYDSYRDLYKLIILSGYPMVYFDEIDPHSDNVYIMTMVNGENQGGWVNPSAEIILYDLEWRLDGEYPKIPGVSEVWAADKWYAEKVGAQYVPLGSHPDLPLTAPTDQPKVWDVAMLAYMTNRRLQTYTDLVERGISVAPNGWHESRDNVLRTTRIMLHVHQNDNAFTVAPQRFALAAAYELPLITEHIWDGGIFHSSHVMMADKFYLPDLVKLWKDDANRLRDYGLALHQLLCKDWTFRKCIEAAL